MNQINKNLKRTMMMQVVERKYFQDCLLDLIRTTVADGKIDKIKLETIINRNGLIGDYLPLFFNRKGIKALHSVIDFRITTAAFNCGLYFRESREIALISGAGIAGLAASFKLLARGFKVVIAEKRDTFSRTNVINLNVEVQRFLKEFHLLKDFEEYVAARISRHRYVLIKKKGSQELALSNVRHLEIGNEPFEPKNFDNLFNNDGIYSVKIQDLQTFLTKKVLEAGAHIFGKVEVEVLAHTKAGGVSKVQIIGKDSLCNPMIFKPHLFFVAEGVHSTTAKRLGMEMNEIENECTGENWIFGNVRYSGNETFVVSIIDTSEETLKIANVIFNAKIHEINIAVTCKERINQKIIENQILKKVQQAFNLENINERPLPLIGVVKHPVHIKNEKRNIFSKDNIFIIGDSAGCSSPLAGLGGTLGLSLIPRTIKQLLIDRELRPQDTHINFKIFSEAYTSRWIAKSQNVKKFCLSIFKQEQIPNMESELDLKDREA
jgi:2-polyprenyl-6-methoxyphenol hydroxylase-like FAD-dependent oxidoreductase